MLGLGHAGRGALPRTPLHRERRAADGQVRAAQGFLGRPVAVADGCSNHEGRGVPQLYPLVMADIAMVKPWPIEIDGLPNLEMVGFSMAMLVIT